MGQDAVRATPDASRRDSGQAEAHRKQAHSREQRGGGGGRPRPAGCCASLGVSPSDVNHAHPPKPPPSHGPGRPQVRRPRGLQAACTRRLQRGRPSLPLCSPSLLPGLPTLTRLDATTQAKSLNHRASGSVPMPDTRVPPPPMLTIPSPTASTPATSSPPSARSRRAPRVAPSSLPSWASFVSLRRSPSSPSPGSLSAPSLSSAGPPSSSRLSSSRWSWPRQVRPFLLASWRVSSGSGQRADPC